MILFFSEMLGIRVLPQMKRGELRFAKVVFDVTIINGS